MRKLIYLAAIAAIAVSCNKGAGTTAPSPTLDVAPVSTPAAPQAAEPQTVAPVAFVPDGFWQKHANFDPQGGLGIQNPTESNYEGQYCYFINGPHPQTRLFAGETFVQAGHFKGFDVPELAARPAAVALAAESCDPVRITVQGDAGFGTFNCDNPSNQLADSGTDDLHAYVYFDIEIPAGREPGEKVEVERSEPYRGERVACPAIESLVAPIPENCDECYEQLVDVTYTDGCKTWVETITLEKIERVEVECPCEDPYRGTPSRDRITFMNKDATTGLYVWRIHNYLEHAAITAKGPGYEETFDTEGQDVIFFTTTLPVYGMSIFDCDGKLLHGTASANETEKLFCEFREGEATECPLPGTCFYNLNEVVGGQEACFDAPGYVSWNERNHLCELTFPGVSLKGWNLNPGQSAEGCLSKND